MTSSENSGQANVNRPEGRPRLANRAAVATLLCCIPAIRGLSTHEGSFGAGIVWPWPATGWVINWDSGFVYRGLIGSILGFFFDRINLVHIVVGSAITCAAYVALMGGVVSRLYRSLPRQEYLFTLLFLMMQPAVVQWWLSRGMIGRFDVILVTGTLLCVVAATAFGAIGAGLSVTAIAIVALLIHEGFGVLLMPTMLVVVMAIRGLRSGTNELALWVLVSVVLASTWLAIALLGRPTAPPEEFLEIMRRHAQGFDLDVGGYVKPIYYMAFAERVVAVIGTLNWRTVLRLALTLVAALPAAIVVGRTWCAVASQLRSAGLQPWFGGLAIAATFSPLAAFFLGCDFVRWLQYVILNNVLAIGALMAASPPVRNEVIAVVVHNRWLALCGITLGLALGPTGVTTSHQLVEVIIQSLG